MMNRIAIFAVVAGISFAGLPARADEPENPPQTVEKVSRQEVWQPGPGGRQISLWPEELAILPPDTGDHPEEVGHGSPLVGGRMWHWASYVTRPTMTIYDPKTRRSDAAIMVLPGGGYHAVATDLEGTEICEWVNALGVTCVLLKYRVPQVWERDENGVPQAPEVQLPLQDAQRAIGLLRERAALYGFDPNRIGVIGFSAGGHLAAAVSNAERRTYAPIDAADGCKSIPDFAILAYPGRLWDENSAATEVRLAPWVEISAAAPPTLLIHAMDDRIDNVRHSLAYGLMLNEKGVPVDMRLYAKGGHAFGMRDRSNPAVADWPEQAEAWLRRIGVLDAAG